MMNDKWLDSIKNRMEDFEESAPDGLWDDIISAMPEKGSERRTAVLPWLWKTVAAAAAAAAVVMVAVLPDRSGHDTIQTNINTEVDLQAELSPSTPTVSSSLHFSEDGTAAGQSAATSGRAGQSSLVAQAVTVDRDVPGRYVPDQHGVQSPAEDEAGVVAQSVQAPVESKPVESKSSDVATEEDEEIYIPEILDMGEGEDWSGRMSLSDESGTISLAPESAELSFGGTASQSKDVSTFDPNSFYRGNAMYSAPAEIPGNEEVDNSDRPTLRKAAVPKSKSEPVEESTRNYRPVRIAMTARWDLPHGLGLESGLAWTLLERKTTTSTGVMSSEERQTLQYIGIPLNLSASLYSTNHLKFYLTGGGMAEKCISARIKRSEYVSGSLVGDPSVKKLSVDALLWSVNAGAGAQFALGKGLGLYFEPGVSYHFDDGSSVQTIYKDHPLDFILTCGLRYSFR
jgi:hypothetical protein